MSSPPVPPTSTAIVLYDPTLPNISVKAHLAGKEEACRNAVEVARFKTQNLSVQDRLTYFAEHLQEMVPFPFSGVIAFRSGDSIVQRCYCPNQTSFSTDQPFNVLSIGKLFTSTAIMQLIEEGKFSLKTRLSELLTNDELDLDLQPPYKAEKPEPSALQRLKQHASEITIEHLLTHRAGFVERSASANEGITEGESWDLNNIGNFHYSNYGYQLLARIIGKHSDCGNAEDHEAGFRAHIETRIFKPAGMQGAIDELHSPTVNNPDRFEVSSVGEPKKVVAKEPYPHGNGCWRMTAGDLIAFDRALHQHYVLIREDTFRIMREHSPRPLGFMRDEAKDSITGYGHPGNGSGMSSFLWTWRDDPPVTAVVLSNYSGCADVKIALDPLLNPP